MQFTRENDRSVNLVRACAPGRVQVNEQEFSRSMILTRERIIPDWSPTVVDELCAADLDDVLALDPEIILVGTGERLRFPDQKLLARALERGVGIECMDTGAACRTYNILVQEGRRVAAALLISTR
ncbi:MAG: Mth938-like domain-containing protein [Gammaproteobacteria bacterium]